MYEVGNETSREDLSKPWPRSPSLKRILNRHLSYSKTYIQFTTFCYNLLVFHTWHAMHLHVPHIALLFSQKSTHTRHILWRPWPCCWTGRAVVIMITAPVYELSGWSSADPKRGPRNFYGGYNTSPFHWEMERKKGRKKRGTLNRNERWKEKYILFYFLKKEKKYSGRRLKKNIVSESSNLQTKLLTNCK